MDILNFTREEIIARIGYFRNKKNITAYDLSLQLGHSKNYFYRIESGENALTMELFLKVLEILELTPLEFFYPNTETFASDMADLKLLKSLSAEERSSIMTLLKIKK